MTTDFKLLAERIVNEAQVAANVLREKGPRRFARPLVFGLVVVYFCRTAVYHPLAAKETFLKQKVITAQKISQYADRYKEASAHLAAFESRLPSPAQKDNWLTDTVMETTRDAQIVPDQIEPPSQAAKPGFLIQTINVSTKLTFPQLVAWLNRVEKADKFLHVSTLKVDKDPKTIGRYSVSCDLSTIIPSQGTKTP